MNVKMYVKRANRMQILNYKIGKILPGNILMEQKKKS